MQNPFKRLFGQRSVGSPWHWVTRFVTNQSSAGVNVTPDNALRVAAVYACIKVIAETLASLPLLLYERVGDGKRKAVDHPLYSLAHDAPNEFMTSFEFREVITTHLCLRGNAYCLKEQNARGIKSLLPLNPAKMEVDIKDGVPEYRYIWEDGKQEVFDPARIWHLKNMPISCTYNGSPPEGYMGASPITIAREAIGLSMAADQYGGRYFSNNATVGLNFQFPGKLSENAKEFLKESLAEYSKLENKFKSIITEEGGKIANLGLANKDSQFLESRQFQIEEIARLFRVPLVLIGHPSNTMTYASAEQLFISFASYTIRPWCLRIEQSMNRYLLPERERERFYFEHNMAGMLRGDTLSRYRAHSIGRQWGWLSVNDVRRMENMDPLGEEGDVYLEPMNMQPAGADKEIPDNVNEEDK